MVKSSTKPDAWTLSPQMTAAPEFWRDVVYCIPFWEGVGTPSSIAPNFVVPTAVGNVSWVFDSSGMIVDFPNANESEDSLQFSSAPLVGADELTVVFIIKADDATNNDRGFLSSKNPDGTDSMIGMRYDEDGFGGGQSNVIKFGISTTSGDSAGESSANSQTSQRQHLVMVWKSGESPKLYIDGELDTPSDVPSSLSGTIGGSNVDRWLIGMGAKDDGTAGTDNWDGKIEYHLVATRKWSSQEVLRHFNDPYSMLRPAGF